MSGRPRDFEKYWAVCGMPRAHRLNHTITWNTAVDETCIALAELLPNLTDEDLKNLVYKLKGRP
jgi:hypothetical protein